MKLTMTREMFHHAHQLMWRELAVTGSKHKHKTTIIRSLNAIWSNHEFSDCLEDATNACCFVCGEDVRVGCTDCVHCPIDWNVSGGTCNDSGSPFLLWRYEPRIEKRKKLAAIIAELLWRKP